MPPTQILVVEDDVIIAMELKDRLQNLGYGVSAVISRGKDAVEKAEMTCPDLVLMDIRLKGEMDGVEAAERIRARFDIPVIYLTAYADEDTLQRAKTTEPYGYILKPFEEREVHTAIEMALYKHKMEGELKRSERWLATTLRSIGDAVIATDENGSVTFMNLVAEALTGWKQKEALGESLKNIFHIVNKEQQTVAGISMSKVLQKSLTVDQASYTLVSRSGREIPIEGSIASISDDRGQITGSVLVFRDIAERKRVEEEKEKIRAQLLQSQKMEAIGLLAGGMAHDFNNLLTSIMGYSELALHLLDDGDSLRPHIAAIHRAGERAARLTQQLLAFSRRQMLQPKVFNLNAAVVEVGEMLGRIVGEDIDLITVLEPRLEWLKADPGQIGQVIVNLVVNAREAMPQGGKLTIKTENVVLDQREAQSIPEARAGPYVCLSITDTGVGIDKKIIEQIFEPFFSTKETGSGLGLSVVHGIVKQHEGWIDVYSEPGKGSTFKVYLPTFSEGVRDDLKERPSLHGLGGKGERILLVEDEESVREFVTGVLTNNGYVVFGAAIVEEALSVFEREGGNFDLVFSDVVLPDKNGLELVDHLLHLKPELHVLLSSGYTDDKSQWPAIRKRGFMFLQKPYAVVDLLRMVREALELA